MNRVHSIAGARTLVRQPVTPIDDITHKRILRDIRSRKRWIGVLAVCLLIGVAMGIAERVYLPILVGGTMNLLWMYGARENIKRLKKQLISEAKS
jgi:hypothetical protein